VTCGGEEAKKKNKKIVFPFFFKWKYLKHVRREKERKKNLEVTNHYLN
jgi:hypothetical protein